MMNINDGIKQEILDKLKGVIPAHDCAILYPGEEIPVYMAEASSFHITNLKELYTNFRGTVLAKTFNIQYSIASIIKNANGSKKSLQNLMKMKFSDLIELYFELKSSNKYFNKILTDNYRKQLNDLKYIRNKLAHLPIAFIINRENLVDYYFPVLQDEKEQIKLPINEVNLWNYKIEHLINYTIEISISSHQEKIETFSLVLMEKYPEFKYNESIITATKPLSLY